jgi:hypothetical protein
MTEFFQSVEFWHWWVLAVALIALEIFAPSFWLIWPGIAAAVVGLLVFLGLDLGIEIQVAIFAVLSVATLFGWRAYARMRPTKTEDPDLNLGARRHIGRSMVLSQPIVERRGKILIDGVYWKVEGDNLAAGTRVRIVAADGLVLKVEAE